MSYSSCSISSAHNHPPHALPHNVELTRPIAVDEAKTKNSNMTEDFAWGLRILRLESLQQRIEALNPNMLLSILFPVFTLLLGTPLEFFF
jgi:hypothetical protein